MLKNTKRVPELAMRLNSTANRSLARYGVILALMVFSSPFLSFAQSIAQAPTDSIPEAVDSLNRKVHQLYRESFDLPRGSVERQRNLEAISRTISMLQRAIVDTHQAQTLSAEEAGRMLSQAFIAMGDAAANAGEHVSLEILNFARSFTKDTSDEFNRLIVKKGVLLYQRNIEEAIQLTRHMVNLPLFMEIPTRSGVDQHLSVWLSLAGLYEQNQQPGEAITAFENYFQGALSKSSGQPAMLRQALIDYKRLSNEYGHPISSRTLTDIEDLASALQGNSSLWRDDPQMVADFRLREAAQYADNFLTYINEGFAE